jgi:hypothetical protein
VLYTFCLQRSNMRFAGTGEPGEAGPKSSSEGSDDKGAGEADDMLSDN